MILIIFIFAIAGLMIAISIVYAAIQLVRTDRQLKRSQKSYLAQRQRTLIEISTTCKVLKNANDNTETEEATEGCENEVS